VPAVLSVSLQTVLLRLPQDDQSNLGPDGLLPDEVATGCEPLLVVGAIAGG
jgi:hypothetical protein